MQAAEPKIWAAPAAPDASSSVCLRAKMGGELFTPSIFLYCHQHTRVSVDFKWNLEQRSLCSQVHHIFSWEERSAKGRLPTYFSYPVTLSETHRQIYKEKNPHPRITALKAWRCRVQCLATFSSSRGIYGSDGSSHRSWKTYKSHSVGTCSKSPNCSESIWFPSCCPTESVTCSKIPKRDQLAGELCHLTEHRASRPLCSRQSWPQHTGFSEVPLSPCSVQGARTPTTRSRVPGIYLVAVVGAYISSLGCHPQKNSSNLNCLI